MLKLLGLLYSSCLGLSGLWVMLYAMKEWYKVGDINGKYR